MDAEKLKDIKELSEHCIATSGGSGSFPLSLGRKLAQNSLDLLDYVTTLESQNAKFRVGDVVRKVGRETQAVALEEAADRVMGPSDVLLDGATCRWIAMELREAAALLRGVDG